MSENSRRVKKFVRMISEYDLKSPSEQLQIYAAACEREESLQDELRWARLEKAAVEFMPAVKEHRVKNNSSASARSPWRI